MADTLNLNLLLIILDEIVFRVIGRLVVVVDVLLILLFFVDVVVVVELAVMTIRRLERQLLRG